MHKLFIMKRHTLPIAALMLGSLAFTGCVDHDYDLSKDMDLNVTIGGESIYLPASSTGYITVDNILDLGSGSSIRAISQQDINMGENYGLALGDYVLVQDASDTHSSVNIERITIRNIQSTTEGQTVPFVSGVSATVPAEFKSDLSLSKDDIDPSVISITEASTDIDVRLNLHYESDTYNGDIIINRGFTIDFGERWNVSLGDATVSAGFAQMQNSHIIEFTDNAIIRNNSPLSLMLKVSGLNLGSQIGEGLYETGHFQLDTEVLFDGNVSIDDSDAEIQLCEVTIGAEIQIPEATLLGVTGIVDPEINIDNTQVKINDIPDFLSSDDNYLDLSDPQIYFTVNNQSPVSATVTALLTGTYSQGKEPVEIYIGDWGNQLGTAQIRINPGMNRICLSRTGQNHGSGIIEVKVEKLGDLLTTIPDEIAISDINMKVVQEPVTFEFSAPGTPGYEFDAKYAAVVPLSFGKDMTLVYEDEEQDWDEEFEKYNFNTVVASLEVLSTVPLALVPEADLLRADGSVFSNVDINVDGEVAPGSLNSPSKSKLTLTISSKGKNLAGLNGIRYKFTAKSGQNTTGVVLNENQNLKFENIKVAIKGGVTVDLND